MGVRSIGMYPTLGNLKNETSEWEENDKANRSERILKIFIYEKHFNNNDKSSKSETGDSEDGDESSRSERIVRINILLILKP